MDIQVLGDYGIDYFIIPLASRLEKYEDVPHLASRLTPVFLSHGYQARHRILPVNVGSMLVGELIQEICSQDGKEDWCIRWPHSKVQQPKPKGAPPETKAPWFPIASVPDPYWITHTRHVLCRTTGEQVHQEPAGTPLKYPLGQRSHYLRMDTVYQKENQLELKPARKKTDLFVIRDYGRQRILPSSNVLPIEEREALNDAHIDVLREHDALMILRTYVTNKKSQYFEVPLVKRVVKTDKRSETGNKSEPRALRNRIILTLNFEELKQEGALLQAAFSWDSILRGAVAAIRQIKCYWHYKAIIIAFSGNGSLLYLPQSDASSQDEPQENGRFTLVYRENRSDLLKEMYDAGRLFGNLSILQAILAYALCKDKTYRTDARGLSDADFQQTVERALVASVYTAEHISREGDWYAWAAQNKDKYYEPLRVEFAKDRVGIHTLTCWRQGFGEKGVGAHPNEALDEDALPSVMRFPESAFLGTKRMLPQITTPQAKGFPAQDASTNTDDVKLPYPFESIVKELIYKSLPDDMNPQHYFGALADKSSGKAVLKLQQADRLIASSGSPANIIFELCRDIVCQGKIETTHYASGLANVQDLIYPDGTQKVRTRCTSKDSASIPHLRMGHYLIYDSSEIRQVCETTKQINSYIADTESHKPLSLCIFGKPGSGKSFLVQEIIDKLKRAPATKRNKPEYIEFNLSQMNEYKDLISAFHKIRDVGLAEKLPFVFFDEFDSRYKKDELGWLRFFLSPMQDGTFMDESGVLHKMGRAIFFFAGGVFTTMDQFRQYKRNDTAETEGSDSGRHDTGNFREKIKLPDFISRVKGFIDVAGPNSTSDGGVLHYFRRTTLLRTMLEKKFNVKEHGSIKIQDEVIAAFLRAKEFYNGARSLQSLIDMSEGRGDRVFKASDVYIGDRLHLYVSDDFRKYLHQRQP
ncbi:MAG: ATP-binding protein [Coriobacteriales bacterium]|jgi:hypothetical protein|nr:ATP-binding protein [Coriobacteriales bacterium]